MNNAHRHDVSLNRQISAKYCMEENCEPTGSITP
jgi:hypothetical protein